MISGRSVQDNQPDMIEVLRLILEREQQRSVAYEEALSVGESLISFYEVLGARTEETENLPVIGEGSSWEDARNG